MTRAPTRMTWGHWRPRQLRRIRRESDTNDFYRLTVESPATLTLKLSGLSDDADLKLLDAAGKPDRQVGAGRKLRRVDRRCRRRRNLLRAGPGVQWRHDLSPGNERSPRHRAGRAQQSHRIAAQRLADQAHLERQRRTATAITSLNDRPMEKSSCLCHQSAMSPLSRTTD